jgi:hypothetical protein
MSSGKLKTKTSLEPQQRVVADLEAEDAASERQKIANRRNARRSTGPTSPEGKRAVRLNGLRHGLLSHDVVLPRENEVAFEEFRTALHIDLAPSGPVEMLFADRVVNAAWRLRRLERLETALLHWRAYQIKTDRLAAVVQSYKSTDFGFAPLSFGATTIIDEAAHARAVKEFELNVGERDREELLLGRALNADAVEGDAFGKLARYETTIERSLYRALHEFQRLQAARQGLSVPLPRAVDIDVSVSPPE